MQNIKALSGTEKVSERLIQSKCTVYMYSVFYVFCTISDRVSLTGQKDLQVRSQSGTQKHFSVYMSI